MELRLVALVILGHLAPLALGVSESASRDDDGAAMRRVSVMTIVVGAAIALGVLILGFCCYTCLTKKQNKKQLRVHYSEREALNRAVEFLEKNDEVWMLAYPDGDRPQHPDIPGQGGGHASAHGGASSRFGDDYYDYPGGGGGSYGGSYGYGYSDSGTYSDGDYR